MEIRSHGYGGRGHFCRNCPAWPRGNYDVIVVPRFPTDLEFCEKCIGLDECGECHET